MWYDREEWRRHDAAVRAYKAIQRVIKYERRGFCFGDSVERRDDEAPALDSYDVAGALVLNIDGAPYADERHYHLDMLGLRAHAQPCHARNPDPLPPQGTFGLAGVPSWSHVYVNAMEVAKWAEELDIPRMAYAAGQALLRGDDGRVRFLAFPREGWGKLSYERDTVAFITEVEEDQLA